MIYPRQKETAKQIFSHYCNGKKIITLVAPVQWGKTGVITETLRFLEMSQMLYDAYIISGISDTEWKKQTQNRVSKKFQHHVFHRPDLKKTYPLLKYGKRICVVIDECHIGAERGMSIASFLAQHGFTDHDAFSSRQLFILQVSATPNHVILDTNTHLSGLSQTIIIQPEDSYIGFDTMLETGRLYHVSNLSFHQHRTRVFDMIKKFNTPKYHIIRCRTTKAHKYFDVEECIRTMCEYNKFDCIEHTIKNTIKNPEEFLSQAPSRHTIILIKNRWSASKTIPLNHIGVCVDTSKDYTALIQGLPGRICGHHSHKPILMCPLQPIQQYLALMESHYDYTASSFHWKSHTIQKEKGFIRSKLSYITRDQPDVSSSKETRCINGEWRSVDTVN